MSCDILRKVVHAAINSVTYLSCESVHASGLNATRKPVVRCSGRSTYTRFSPQACPSRQTTPTRLKSLHPSSAIHDCTRTPLLCHHPHRPHRITTRRDVDHCSLPSNKSTTQGLHLFLGSGIGDLGAYPLVVISYQWRRRGGGSQGEQSEIESTSEVLPSSLTRTFPIMVAPRS
jgi:hypothetical protein